MILCHLKSFTTLIQICFYQFAGLNANVTKYLYPEVNICTKPSWIIFTGTQRIILPLEIHLTFILKSENSIRLLLIQTMRYSHLFHVRHLVQSASEPRFPSRRIGRLSFSIFASVFSPQLKQHRVLLDNKIGFASVLPRYSELFKIFVSPTQSRHFSAVDFVF